MMKEFIIKIVTIILLSNLFVRCHKTEDLSLDGLPVCLNNIFISQYINDPCFEVYSYKLISEDTTSTVYGFTSKKCPHEYVSTFYFSDCSILCESGGYNGNGTGEYTSCLSNNIGELTNEKLIYKNE